MSDGKIYGEKEADKGIRRAAELQEGDVQAPCSPGIIADRLEQVVSAETAELRTNLPEPQPETERAEQ